jgi:predicted AlkP superfamily phosphohydrolase/phosphomutase
MIDNTNESDALIEMSPISNIKLENKFFSQDYKENEYNYLIFNTMSTVDKAVSTLNSWTEISSLNVIIRFDRGLFKLQKNSIYLSFFL